MCKYCEQSESLFYDKHSEGIREVVVEQDGTLNICSNDYDREEMKKSMAIGFSFDKVQKWHSMVYQSKLTIVRCVEKN